MNMYKQMAVIVVAAMCAGTTANARTATFAIKTPNMAFEIDGDASNARFDFPRNTVRDKDFWRLILDDGARTEIPVFSHAQKDLNPHSEQFPALFRYTFPEVIVSNRGVRNAEGDFARMLRNALVYGIRYDAELYVCRRTIDAAPAYADTIGRCCKKMRKYGEFYFDGRFTVLDTSPLPPGVVRGEFLNKDGTKILTVLHNASGKPAMVKGVTYPPGNLSFNITSLNNNG